MNRSPILRVNRKFITDCRKLLSTTRTKLHMYHFSHASQNTYWRASVSMRSMWQDIFTEISIDTTQNDTYGGKAV